MNRGRYRFGRSARGVRIAAATIALVLAFFGLFAAGLEGTLAERVAPSLQLFPAAARMAAVSVGAAGLTGAVGLLAILLASTLLGRWYCAFLCPLGTLQDLASLVRGKKRGWHEPVPLLRIVLLLGVLYLAISFSISLASWIDPWSIFGRFVAYDVQPLARLAVRADNPNLRPEIVAAAGLTVAFILIASAFHGRWFCGNLCPVGTVLGLLNRAAPFRLRMDESSCISCGRCTAVCRASCIDGGTKKLDESRCVYCLACAAACPTGAIRYGRANRTAVPAVERENDREKLGASPLSRARVIVALGAGAVTLTLAARGRKGSSSRLLGKALDGQGPVTPPGSRSVGLYLERCTACGLCVARCPAKILRPSVGQLGVAGLLVPRLDYDVSYCQYDCTACLDLCPSGALEKLSLAQKKLTKIGDSTLIPSLCVVIKNGTRCGACAEHCPTGAVRMVVGRTGLPEPVFNSAICIGCGACHHACPVEPDKAISVSGLAEHRTAEIPSKTLFDSPDSAPKAAEKDDAFPF